MSVDVATADLRGYASLLERNAGHIEQVCAYVKQWAGKEMQAINSEGLMAKALDFHDKAYARSVEVLDHLALVLRGSAGELKLAADKYDTTDAAARDRLDKLSQSMLGPDGVGTRAGWEATAKGFQDIRDPGSHTKVEPSVLEVRDEIDKVLNSITDATSLSGAILRVVEELTGRKPVEELVEFVSGDWENFSKCADVWDSVADTLEDVAYNIDHGNAAMDYGWSGTASEVAYSYFAGLADVLMDLRRKFREMSEGYQAYAKWVFMITSILADTVKMLIDLALQLLLRKKGSSIPLFAEAYTAFYAFKIVKLVAKFGWMVIGARGTAAGFFLTMAFVDEDLMGAGPVLRAKSYDMAGVAPPPR